MDRKVSCYFIVLLDFTCFQTETNGLGNIKYVLVCVGVCSIRESVSYSLPSRHSEGIGWACTETGLHPSWGHVEADGHADLQHVALVAPQRQFSRVRFPSIFLG